ncbi:unnamed protein product [Phaedon cochleariae]|uniref:Uncharacterized protein n=1 Tax=Phaedon cochleariae TaxID=80249 RepID=A0A9N9SHK2_PHACE|nr:unnamed protein product [Phaedon cochleariae]
MTGSTMASQRQPQSGFAISDILELDRQTNEDIDPITTDTSMYSPHQDMSFNSRHHWLHQLSDPSGLPSHHPHLAVPPPHAVQLSPDSTSPAVSERSSVDPTSLSERDPAPDSRHPRNQLDSSTEALSENEAEEQEEGKDGQDRQARHVTQEAQEAGAVLEEPNLRAREAVPAAAVPVCAGTGTPGFHHQADAHADTRPKGHSTKKGCTTTKATPCPPQEG